MYLRTFILTVLMACFLGGFAQKNRKEAVQSIIFDTDFGPDYDDVGAITMLHAYADSGFVDILATIASCSHANVAPALSVFNTYFNRPDLPIAVPKGKSVSTPDRQHWTDSVIADYPHAVKSNADVPDAVTTYRKILAGQKDKSVVVVTVGFLTNLAGLLASGPDEFSPLSGRDLVKKKVKRLVSMAGKFPTGKEFNIEEDAAASVAVFKGWPTPVILSGFEIGEKIKSGLPLVQDSAVQDSPVRDVFRICIPLDEQDKSGRMSWDETAVLVAARGVAPYYDLVPGRIYVASDGTNTWDARGKGHSYLVEKMPYLEVEKIINALLLHQPVKK